MKHPSSYIAFIDEVKQLEMGSFGRSADHMSIKLNYLVFRSAVDGCNVLEGFDKSVNFYMVY